MNSVVKITCGRCGDETECPYGMTLPILCGHCGRKYEETPYEAELRSKLDKAVAVLKRFERTGYVKPGEEEVTWYPFREALIELEKGLET